MSATNPIASPFRAVRRRITSRLRVRRVLSGVVATGAVLAAAGCASIARGAFKAPIVHVKQFAITGLGLTGGSVDIVLSVYNPNGYKLDALSMTYLVDVDSVKLGEGMLDKRFIVAGNDSSTVHVPVQFTYAGLGTAGRSLLTAGAINYRVRGDFKLSTPVGDFTRPYDQKGRYSNVKGNGR